MFYIMMTLVGLAALAMAGAAVVGYIGTRTSDTAKELVATKRQHAIALKTLRTIAAGAGRPELEAQLALEELNNLEIKELNDD